MTRFIAILSGKGGVGKTTVSINLGAALKSLGKNVVLLDANLTNPDIGLYLGHPNFPSNINHFFRGEKDIHEILYRHHCGIDLIPGEIDNSKLNHTDSDFKKLLNRMQGISDFVIIDCAGGLNKDIRDILEFSDEALVVTNPDLISSTNALKAIKTAEECNSTVLGVVLNKIKEEHNSSETENYLGIPVISEIKYDDYFEKKKPLEGNYTKEEVLLRFRELAKKLM